jgi:hypothetical protein
MRRAIGSIAGAVLVLLAIALSRTTRPGPRLHVAPEPTPLRASDPVERAVQGSPAFSPPTPAKPAEHLGVASVWIEKPSVCLGEPTRIRVTPSYAGVPAGRVTAVIGGHPGLEASFLATTGEPGVRHVVVSLVDEGGSERTPVTSEATIEVLPCVADRVLLADATPLAGAPDAFALRARLLRGDEWERRTRHASAASDDGPLEVAAARYRWRFGDDTTAVTTEGSVTHAFPREADRPAGELAHAYLVRVDALDDSDRVLGVGYASVSLQNVHGRLELLHHVIALDAEYSQFPERDGAGGLASKVVLRNPSRTETVILQNVEVTKIGCDGRDAGREQLAPGSVLASDSVPAGGRVEGRWAVDGDAAEGICYLDAVVTGVSRPAGMTASGSFSMTVGRDPRGTLVTGDDRAAALTLARAQLGNPLTIGPDDMIRLEEEGKIPRGSLTAYLPGGPRQSNR